MLRRLLAILLIPFFVVGNSFAHCHDTGPHSSPGQSRAHFHFSSHSHPVHHNHRSQRHPDHQKDCDHEHDHCHDHRHDDCPLADSAPVDHDSDAIYVSAVDYWFSAAQHGPLEIGSGDIVAFFEDDAHSSAQPIRRDLRRHSLASGPPLYLLHAVLRL